ncbi:MAG TPA: cytochrome c3 family protein [Verrucomicrobiae bacterium]|nr:cytochrome c3 family protein [Verrucomicrobiae bacterium]
MPQIFRRGANSLARASIVIAPVLMIATGAGVWAVWWSPYMTRVNVALDQPVPFSHEHHVSGLGIDCRYCHTTAEFSSTAGLPPTETCMTCHSQVWTDAPVLEPVRESWRTGRPLQWNRVHDLPDFVFFDHGIHVQKGIGCATCHGRVDQMPLTRKENTLWMKWCLDCHSNPEKKIRPKEEVFDMAYQPPPNQDQFGRELVSKYNVHTERLKDCSMCHR